MRTHPTQRTTLGAALPLVVVVLAAEPARGQAPTAPSPPSAILPFVPDTVLTPPSGPRIVRLPAPGSPVVSLRLSVPIREGSAEAGVGRVLQMLGTERATSLGRPVGATVEGTRTPWSIAYTVTGAAADIDFLAYLLREAVRDPAGRRVDLQQAVADLETDARRRQETPGGRVAAQLRTATTSTPPIGGTLGSLGRLTMADVRAAWARSHRPEDMTLLVAGDVPLEVLLASLQGLGAPSAGGATAPAEGAVSEPSRARIQVLRHWYGEARPLPDDRDPHGEVAALLVADRLRTGGGGGEFEAEVQLWQLPEIRVLAVVGAAYSAGRQAMRGRIQGILAETAEALAPADVERAVTRLESDLRMRARTPAGRAGVVGLHLDATGEVGAAGDYLDALGAVTTESARRYLATLSEIPPEQAEVRP